MAVERVSWGTGAVAIPACSELAGIEGGIGLGIVVEDCESIGARDGVGETVGGACHVLSITAGAGAPP
jgi:hypothetical protein